MPWDYEVEGYMDGHTGERHFDGEPSDVHQTDGLLVHGWDKDDPENDIWFWVYDPLYFYDWEAAHAAIEIMFEEYGIPYA